MASGTGSSTDPVKFTPASGAEESIAPTQPVSPTSSTTKATHEAAAGSGSLSHIQQGAPSVSSGSTSSDNVEDAGGPASAVVRASDERRQGVVVPLPSMMRRFSQGAKSLATKFVNFFLDGWDSIRGKSPDQRMGEFTPEERAKHIDALRKALKSEGGGLSADGIFTIKESSFKNAFSHRNFELPKNISSSEVWDLFTDIVWWSNLFAARPVQEDPKNWGDILVSPFDEYIGGQSSDSGMDPLSALESVNISNILKDDKGNAKGIRQNLQAVLNNMPEHQRATFDKMVDILRSVTADDPDDELLTNLAKQFGRYLVPDEDNEDPVLVQKYNLALEFILRDREGFPT